VRQPPREPHEPPRLGRQRCLKRPSVLGEPVPGTKARELELVDRLAEPGKVRETALELAERPAQAPPATIGTTKSVFARQPLSLDAMLAWEADTQTLLTGTVSPSIASDASPTLPLRFESPRYR